MARRRALARLRRRFWLLPKEEECYPWVEGEGGGSGTGRDSALCLAENPAYYSGIHEAIQLVLEGRCIPSQMETDHPGPIPKADPAVAGKCRWGDSKD